MGWGDYYREDTERQERYYKMAFDYSKTELTPETSIMFNEVFDSVAFLYVIR